MNFNINGLWIIVSHDNFRRLYKMTGEANFAEDYLDNLSKKLYDSYFASEIKLNI